MSPTVITCPKCQEAFELTSAIEQPIMQKLRAKFDADAALREREMLRREADVLKQAGQLKQTIAAEQKRITAEAQRTANESASLQVRELNEKLAQKDKRLLEAEEAELRLRLDRDKFEEQKRAFELEIARRTDKIKADVGQAKDDEFRLKLAEKDKQLSDVTVQLDEAKRKAEQGSQQAQGEVLELDLEGALRRCFESDDVVPVAKGVHGGDLVQHVCDEAGHECGSIIWESKRTKTFSDGWLDKLKQDKLAARAHLAVLISTAMPKDAAGFECRENVWIAPPRLAVPLCAALRLVLIETAGAKRAVEGRHDKMEVVYDYLAGQQFKARVSAIVEAFTAMREDLEAEKRLMHKSWTKREKQIERVLANTAGMYGELSGIIGKSLPAIEALELPSLPEPAAKSIEVQLSA